MKAIVNKDRVTICMIKDITDSAQNSRTEKKQKTTVGPSNPLGANNAPIPLRMTIVYRLNICRIALDLSPVCKPAGVAMPKPWRGVVG